MLTNFLEWFWRGLLYRIPPLNDLRLLYLQNKLPKRVMLESTTMCQLNCASCYMRANTHKLGIGYLTFENFKRFVEQNKYIKSIELANNGEFVLNPDLIHIVKYAYEKKITLTAEAGSNFNNVSDELLEALAKYKFAFITISLDGASTGSYSKYRRNGDFNRVLDNIKKLNKYKQKYNSILPKLRWQFIIFGHNEQEVSQAKKMATDLEMEIYFKPTWDKDFIPQNPEKLKAETGLHYLTRNEYHEQTGWFPNVMCPQLWTHPAINWDGRLLGCCGVTRDDFGVNVFEVGLKKALNTPKFICAKNMLLGRIDAPDDTTNIPCADCFYYKYMKEHKRYFKL
jgi:MoaA/NifB/PqqE/SkfB family radical SAM enzyme